MFVHDLSTAHSGREVPAARTWPSSALRFKAVCEVPGGGGCVVLGCNDDLFRICDLNTGLCTPFGSAKALFYDLEMMDEHTLVSCGGEDKTLELRKYGLFKGSANQGATRKGLTQRYVRRHTEQVCLHRP